MMCPNCGKELKLTCKRCGHKWSPKTDINPKRCPDCKSPYWNKKRGQKRGRPKVKVDEK